MEIKNLKIPINDFFDELDDDIFLDLFKVIIAHNLDDLKKDLVGDTEIIEGVPEELVNEAIADFFYSMKKDKSGIKILKQKLLEKAYIELNSEFFTLNDITDDNSVCLDIVMGALKISLENYNELEDILNEKKVLLSMCSLLIIRLSDDFLGFNTTKEEIIKQISKYHNILIDKYIEDYFKILDNKKIEKNKIEKLEDEIKELKVEKKSLKNELNIVNKNIKDTINNEVKNTIDKHLKKYSVFLNECIKDIEGANYKTLKASYESLLEQSENRLSNLKHQLILKNEEIRLLKQNQLNEDSIKNYIYENKDNESFINLLLETIDLKEYIVCNTSEVALEAFDESVINVKQECEEMDIKEDNEEIIGYYKVIEDTPCIITDKGEHISIKNIPRSLYLGEGQFLKVYKDGVFIKNYDCMTDNLGLILTKGQYVEVIVDEYGIDNKYYTYINDERVSLNVLNDNYIIMNDSIAVIDESNNIVRLFKKFKYNLDTLLKSINMKGDKPCVVVNNNLNRITLKNILTEEYINITSYIRNINKGYTLILNKDNEIISQFNVPYFYTTSSFYKNKRYIRSQDENGIRKFVDIFNDEYIDLNLSTNYIIPEDTVVVIDEYGNILERFDDDKYFTESKSNKKYKKKQFKNAIGNIIPKAKVLIVGDSGLENGYKVNLYKNEYKATVVDGFSTLNTIKRMIKDNDIVVGIPNHMSHENFFAVKDLKEPQSIISPHDGANRIVEQLNEIFG